jgi:hypothetical protein
MNVSREQMIGFLHEGVCIVQFEKVNGDMRNMECTLDASLLPTVQEDKTQVAGFTPNKQVNEKVLAVWDVNAKGWRSFRIDSVKKFSTYSR